MWNTSVAYKEKTNNLLRTILNFHRQAIVWTLWTKIKLYSYFIAQVKRSLFTLWKIVVFNKILTSVI